MRTYLTALTLLFSYFLSPAYGWAQESSFFFYDQGKKVFLHPSPSLIHIELNQAPQSKTSTSLQTKFTSSLQPTTISTSFLHKEENISIKPNMISAALEMLRQDERVVSAYPVFIEKGEKVWARNRILALKPAQMDDIEWFDVIEKEGLTIGEEISFSPQRKLFVLMVESGVDVFQMANRLIESKITPMAHPEFSYEYHTKFLPDDALFGSQWFLHSLNDRDIDAVEAWDLTKGSSQSVVAVLDDGFLTNHPDMIGKTVNPYNAINQTNDVLPAGNLNNHGTPCMGLIGANSNNQLGVSSVGFHVRVMPIVIASVNPDNTWTLNDVIIARAASHIINDNRVVAVSNSYSLGFRTPSSDLSYQAMATQGRNGKGATVLASTGNDSSTLIAYPASHSDVIAVGASDASDSRAFFSNFGTGLDVVAPGVSTRSLDRIGNNGYVQQDYVYFNGTSAACPITAGVIGLMASANPNLTGIEMGELLISSAEKVGNYTYSSQAGLPLGTWNNEMGYGRINAYQAVLAALNASCTIDAQEPNDQAAQAIQVPLGGSYISPDMCLDLNDQDWFRFSCGNIFYYVKVSGGSSSSTGSYYLTIGNSLQGGVAIETHSTDGSLTDTHLTLYSPDLINIIATADNQTTDPFAKISHVMLHCGGQNACYDVWEPNPGPSSASDLGALHTSFVYSNPDLCLSNNDEDWFTFTCGNDRFYIRIKGLGNSTGAYQLSVSSAAAPNVFINTSSINGSVTDTEIYLYDATGPQQIAYANNFQGQGPFAGLTYTLPCAVGVCNDPFEDNDEITKAYNLGAISSFDNNQLCLILQDEDWMSFSYQGREYLVQVRGFAGNQVGLYGLSIDMVNNQITVETYPVNGSNMDTRIGLYSRNVGSTFGTEVAHDWDSGQNKFSRVVYNIPQAGLTIDPGFTTVGDSAGRFYLSLIGNLSWTATTYDSWISLDKTNGNGTQDIIIDFLPNHTNQIRLATVEITTNNQIQQFTIAQLAGGTTTSILSRVAGIKVFPNPASSYLTIRPQEGTSIRQIEMLSPKGKRISQWFPSSSLKEIHLEVNALTEGLYFLRMESSTSVLTEKILIKR
ncbi:MAG: S8 family serine peptidase [Bacteroidota bacterium]